MPARGEHPIAAATVRRVPRVRRALVRRRSRGVWVRAARGCPGDAFCVGADLVDVRAFRARFARRPEVLETVFTPAELAYSRAQARPWEHLAARFAAKEAVLKALGTGLAGALAWRDVEVVRDEAGAPALVFHRALAGRLSRFAARLSLAHTRRQALAVVVLWRR